MAMAMAVAVATSRRRSDERKEKGRGEGEVEGEDSQIAFEIARLALERYSSLKKTGKPTTVEWTVLAAVVVSWRGGDGRTRMRAVGMGTGTKCIGGSAAYRSARGETLNDGHAETIARRCFVAWVYSQLFAAASCGAGSAADGLANDDDDDMPLLLERAGEGGEGCTGTGWQFRADVRFHMFISKSPCGCCTDSDCSDKSEDENPNDKRMRVRRKPGRGMKTLSASCTDKVRKSGEETSHPFIVRGTMTYEQK